MRSGCSEWRCQRLGRGFLDGDDVNVYIREIYSFICKPMFGGMKRIPPFWQNACRIQRV